MEDESHSHAGAARISMDSWVYPPSLFVPAEVDFGQAPPLSRVRRRPGLVEAAAVLAFNFAGLSLMSATLASPTALFTGSFTVLTNDPYLKFAFLVSLLCCGAFIWGGIAALAGHTNKILLSGAALWIAMTVVDTVVMMAGGAEFNPLVLLRLIVPTALIICLQHRWSLAWFQAQGGRTFGPKVNYPTMSHPQTPVSTPATPPQPRYHDDRNLVLTEQREPIPYPTAPVGQTPVPHYPAVPPGEEWVSAPGRPGLGMEIPRGAFPSHLVTERPRKVTAAAVLAFVSAGLTILVSAFLYTGPGRLVVAQTTLLLLLLPSAVICVLYIWGGVQALAGRSGKLLVIGAVLAMLTTVGGEIFWAIRGIPFEPRSLTALILPAIILTRLLHPWSRNWFRAVGGSTF